MLHKTFRSMAYIFEYLQHEYISDIKEGWFIDIGSGSGKGVIAAALLHPFAKCVGIEYLEKLHLMAISSKNLYDQYISSLIQKNPELFVGMQLPNTVDFVNNDFLKESWENASIILANSTCFSLELIHKIGKKANRECKSGTTIVTFTKRITNLGDEWDLKDGFRRNMSWGIATIYVHRKL